MRNSDTTPRLRNNDDIHSPFWLQMTDPSVVSLGSLRFPSFPLDLVVLRVFLRLVSDSEEIAIDENYFRAVLRLTWRFYSKV